MRRLGAVGAVLALALGFVVVSDTAASAAKPTVTAVGEAGCAGIASGKVKFKPALTTGGGAGTGHATYSLKLENCGGTTGNPAVAPVGAKIKITTTTVNLGCTGLLEGGTATATIKWKAQGGRMTPTTIVWAAHGGLSDLANNLVYNHFPGFGNTGVISGSYAGNAGAILAIVFAETPAAVTAGCAAPKGLKKLTVTGNKPIVSPSPGNAPTSLSIFPNP